jgi:predicted ATPase/class 3 adenylate cyclase
MAGFSRIEARQNRTTAVTCLCEAPSLLRGTRTPCLASLVGGRDSGCVTGQPTGTVTLLFTDVEGSTKLLDALGSERYAEVLEAHRRLLREVFSCHGGYEVDTEGDAFFVAFSRAQDAVAAAGEGQRALAEAEWPDGGEMRVRMGIHTGEPLLLETHYVGMDVHRAARIMSAGHGGQVVVSETTAGLLDGGLRDLGQHRLKDLLVPIRLYQLEIDGLPNEFPPLRSLHRMNLPVAAWPLLGRERELGEIGRLLEDGARLVTLTGPGGSGKTRLALQAAAELSDEYADGVFFVGLAPLRDLSAVSGAVAEAVGLQPDDDVDAWLASRRSLLVLDNLEHLSGVDAVVAQLLVGESAVLATSRAPLRLTTEHELPVESLTEDAAVELFVSRAAAAGRRVEADDTVAEVCRRLDNLPLALELAAARSKLLSPSALLQRLDTALPLLTGAAGDRPERQRTLRATIEWSHDLLDSDTQAAFRRLSVFRGSFTLDAAEAITGADLDQLSALLDQSLLKLLGDDRFFLLETIREYAREQLDKAGETAEYESRHARHYAERSEALHQEAGSEAGSVFIAEATEIRAALAFAQAHDDADTQLRLLTAAGRVFRSGSQHDYGEALKAALSQPTSNTNLRGRAEDRLAFIEFRRGDYLAARAAAERGLDLGERTNDDELIIGALDMLGIVALCEGDLDRSRELHERVLATHPADDYLMIASTLVNLGDVALVAGEYERAIELNTEAMEISRERGGSALSLQVPLINLAAAHAHLGHVAEAEAAAAASLEAAPNLRDPLAVAFALRVYAAASAWRGDHDRAALFLGAGDALDAELGARADPTQNALREHALRQIEDALGVNAADSALERGRSLSADEALELARSLAKVPDKRL